MSQSHSSGLFINNGQINKRVLSSELEKYLEQGWQRGMKPRDPTQIKVSNQRRRATCQKKYGVDNVHQLDSVKKKAEKTCYQKYGVSNPAKAEKIKEKTKATNQILWPDPHNYHNIAQRNKTMIQKYGSLENFYKWRTKNMDWPKTLKKQAETKRKNNSFRISKPEEDLYLQLCQQYGKENVLRNYKDEKRYPFFCDFYIVSEDLFIELNRHWTHGGHFFEESNPEDIKQLKKWKEKAKSSKYFQYAIKNWTEKDPLKRQIAKTNKIKYKVIW